MEADAIIRRETFPKSPGNRWGTGWAVEWPSEPRVEERPYDFSGPGWKDMIPTTSMSVYTSSERKEGAENGTRKTRGIKKVLNSDDDVNEDFKKSKAESK